MHRLLAPDRNVPGWIWAVSGAAVVAAVVVAWLVGPVATEGASRDQKAARPLARLGVVQDGFLVRHDSPLVREFDVHRCAVDPQRIVALIPARDAVPSLDRPAFATAGEGASVKADELVFGVKIGGEAHCYPLRLLAWHVVVNDKIAGKPVAVAFDPISNAGVAVLVDAGADGRPLQFGVSGRAYMGEGLLFDRQTNSLWSMLRGSALAGPMTGTKLRRLHVDRMTFARWRGQHAKTAVLQEDTGFDRPYEDDPYAQAVMSAGADPVNYWREQDALIAPLPKGVPLGKYGDKELVLGVEAGGTTKAYPLSEIVRAGNSLKDQVGGVDLQVKYDAHGHYATATAASGDVWTVVCFWGAWRAAHPTGQVYEAPRQAPSIGADAQA